MSKLSTCILLLVLLVTPSLSINTYTARKAYQSVASNKGSWGQILLTLAELHSQTQGPVDELVQAIEEVVEDLGAKRQKADEEFEARTVFHESETIRIQDLIDSAAEDIAATRDLITFLQNHLQSLENSVVNLENGIADFKQQIEDATAERERNHQEYVEKIPDHEEAIAAIEEATAVLSQLSDTPSFIQTKSLKKHFDNIQKVHVGQETAMLKALVELAMSQQFNDGATVQRVLNLLAEIKNKIVASLAQFEEQEAQEQAAYELLVKELTDSINQFELQLAETKNEIDLTNERLAGAEDFLQVRTQDKAEQEEALALENEAYEKYTQNYHDLVEQLTREQEGCAAALDVLQSGEFAGYIGNRMEQKSDVIIDTAHGEGITVEKDPFDFE